jgi:AcrR family transcriptional regulator
MKKQSRDGTLHKFALRRTPRQKRSQIVYDKIIATAKSLFKQYGYAYVSTNRIADKANISIGSLYQYFRNGEAIALAVYEEACSKAALTMKRRTLESLSAPIEVSVPRLTEWVFEVFEKDRYALLQLINEVPELRRAAQPLSFESLIHHTTQMFFEQHFTDVDRAVIARKAYIIDKCVIGVISRYLDEKPDCLNKNQAISEITEFVTHYAMTFSRHRKTAVARSSQATPESQP